MIRQVKLYMHYEADCTRTPQLQGARYYCRVVVIVIMNEESTKKYTRARVKCIVKEDSTSYKRDRMQPWEYYMGNTYRTGTRRPKCVVPGDARTSRALTNDVLEHYGRCNKDRQVSCITNEDNQ